MALLGVAGVVASPLLEPLVERIISAAAGEYRLIRGVRGEIWKLDSTLNLIRRLLEDAEKRQVGDTAIGDWLRELKQVFLDADDVLDGIATEAALRSIGADEVRPMRFGCFACIRRTMTSRATAHQILQINERLDHLASKREKLGLQMSLPGVAESSRLESIRRPQTTSLLADEKSVIGRDGERRMIVQLLLSSAELSSSNKRNFSVLPIVGMGGMGKTTLAKLVFNDENVQRHFELRMWVCVSNDFEPTRLAKEMIDAAFASRGKNGPYHPSTNHLDSMQQRLRQEVRGKTFLLVLDDVWEADRSQWDSLFEPLKFGNKGSKIVITTRNGDVVDKIQGPIDPAVPLGGLSCDHIWSLFRGHAFDGVMINADGTVEAKHFHLESIGRHIVGRLKGSPLAARTIGSLLNTELDAQHWKKVLNNSEIWRLAQEADGIFPVLGFSYQYLRADLKQCFSYCSLFPKDYRFRKDKLVQLWNAQGFLRMEKCTVIEVTGNRYCDHLVKRSFLSPDPRYEDAYVMHDLLHDLAECVSKDDCFRLEDRKASMEEIPVTVRHMSSLVAKFDRKRLEELCKREKLRTLVFLRSCAFDDLTRDLNELFLKLKRLRVLGLSDLGITELPHSIGDLKHLRYIDLSYNEGLVNLPESLGNLHNLQVLNLDGCSSLRVFPSGMRELINLRHLRAEGMLASNIDGLCKLTGLQELHVGGEKVGELEDMSMLRRLHISRLEDVVGKGEAARARLGSKEHLQELVLEWRDGRGATSIDQGVEEVLEGLRPADNIRDLSIIGYEGVKSPGWLEGSVVDDGDGRHVVLAFPSLRQLTMRYCSQVRDMPSLPPTVTHLSLTRVGLTSLPGVVWAGCHGGGRDGDEPYPSYSSSASAGALSDLVIHHCPNLTSLGGLLRHNLTALTKLEVWYCSELANLPESGFGHLVSLKKLDIFRCPKLTCPAFERGEDAPVPPLSLPRSLEHLRIEGCGDAMGGWWWEGLQHLTCLAHLTLGGCPTTAESFFLTLGRHRHRHHLATSTLTELRIYDCGFDCQQQQQQQQGEESSTDATWGFQALTSLRQFELYRSPNLLLKCGLGALPSSLQSLTIEGDNLNDECPSACLRDVASLDVLSICKVGDLSSLPSMGSCLTFLDTLVIEFCHQLQTLPEIVCPPLRNLFIWSCQNLRSLPATLSCLSSLERLCIRYCVEIESLPETGVPASLRCLYISGCPLLAARCRDRECPDWPKICHIPEVHINWKRII